MITTMRNCVLTALVVAVATAFGCGQKTRTEMPDMGRGQQGGLSAGSEPAFTVKGSEEPGGHAAQPPPVWWHWVSRNAIIATPAPERAPGGHQAWLDALAEEAGEERPLAILNLREKADPVFGERVAATLHIAVADFTPPTTEQADRAVAFIRANVADGRVVVVHCLGGCGRTGTILAAYLKRTQQIDGMEAIRQLRTISPCFVETKGQEAFVREY